MEKSTIGDHIPMQITDKIETYLDLKNSIIDDGYLDFVGDLSSIGKLFISGYKAISKWKFKAFLKGFYNNEAPSIEQLGKLSEYIDDEKKAAFIADMFSKVLFSNSKIACTIMGSIVHELTKNKSSLSADIIVCSNAIKDFFDHDIYNYMFIYEYIKKDSESSVHFEDDEIFKSHCITGSADYNSIAYTIEKSVSLQLFSKNINVAWDPEYSTSMYYISNAGEIIFSYIKRVLKN